MVLLFYSWNIPLCSEKERLIKIIPLKVEYYLTDARKELIPVLDKLKEWRDKHKDMIINKTIYKSE